MLIPQIVSADFELQEFLVPVTETCDCIIFAQMEIRNSSEQITAVIIPRSYFYLEHQLTHDSLSQIPVKEQVFLNQKNYDLREITTDLILQENNHFLDRISLSGSSEAYHSLNTIFYATDLGYPIAEGDKLTTKWKILTLTN